jgi:hypothetical protein
LGEVPGACAITTPRSLSTISSPCSTAALRSVAIRVCASLRSGSVRWRSSPWKLSAENARISASRRCGTSSAIRSRKRRAVPAARR